MKHLKEKVLNYEELLEDLDEVTGGLKVIKNRYIQSCGFNKVTVTVHRSLCKLLRVKSL